MNKTKVTKRKGSNTKKDKESTEVFVLPPNLLQQLGINLGNIGSALENTTDSQVTDPNLPTKEKNARENRLTPKKQLNHHLTSSESSIIETAELMKKSVFLSPTFVSHNSNVIQGEIEIVGIGEPESTEQKVSLGLVNHVFGEKKMEEAARDKEKGYGSVSNVYQQNSPSFFWPTQETTQCLTANASDPTLYDNQVKTVVDDHADEAYSSDCSNSNIGCPVKAELNKSCKNKINIISEQIIHPSELYKLKSCFTSSETPLINVSINTIIRSHNKNSDCYENVLHKDIIPNLTTNMESSEKTVGNEYKKSESLFPKIESTENKILNNVTNYETCAAISSNHSEFIVFTPNSENSDKDGKILQELYENDDFIKNKADAETGIAIPYHIDTVEESNIINEVREDFTTNTERYSNQIQVEMNEHFQLVDIGSCLDGKTIRLESDTLSNNSESGVVVENILIAHVIGTENRNQNIEQHIEKCYSSEQKNNEQTDKIQNGETALINYETNIVPLNNELANQSTTKDLSIPVDNPHVQSGSNYEVKKNTVNKSKSSRDTLLIKQYKQGKNELAVQPVIDTFPRSPIDHENPNDGKNEPGDDQYKHKRILQNNESCEIEIISNESNRGNNDEKVDRTHETTVIQEDKVREIAKYLSEFADMHKRNKLNEKQKGAASSKNLSNKNRSTCSKSSIQGVEKPGGSKINSIKTYGRTRTRLQGCKIPPMCIFQNSNTDSESINVINSCDDFEKEMELCLCDDFGRLAYYDSDNSYEHVHFWNNAKSDCPPDVIFSIYNEINEDAPAVAMVHDANISKEEYSTIEYSNEVFHTTDRKLCWNELKVANINTTDDDDDRPNLNKVGDDEENNTNEGTTPDSLESHDRQNIGKQPICQKKITANLSQNCDEPPINNIITDEHSEKPGKKRKRSIINEEYSEPPAKKRGNISRELSGRKGRLDVSKDQISTNVEKTYRRIRKSNVEDPSTLFNGTTKDSAEHNPHLLNTDKKSLEPPFVSSNEAKSPSSIPVNDAINPAANDGDQSSSSEQKSIIEVELNLPVKTDSNKLSSVSSNESGVVVCDVCKERVEDTDWIRHIASQHNYLAWKSGEPGLDVNNEDEIRDHLAGVAKSCGGLECAKCGLTRKYAKAYLSHIRSCNGLNESQNDSTYNLSSDAIIAKEEQIIVISNDVAENEPTPDNDLIKCAVCEESLQIADWNHHIRTRHDYLAWKVGESPIDVHDETQVRGHLYQLSKTCGGLTCSKCGLTRKYVKAYLSHIKSCDGLNESQNDGTYEVTLDVIPGSELRSLVNGALSYKENNSNGFTKCGVCGESVQEKDWNSHIASQHDYLAWRFGDSPLGIEDEAAVKEHLYEISKACGGLTCSKCGVVRKYVKAYLNHVKSCNGADESQDDTSNCISTVVNPGTASVDLIIQPTTSAEDEQKPSVSGAVVKCAVCRDIVQEEDWYSHILSRHDYLAWKFGEFSLDVNDEAAVRTHLQEIAKASGGLTCSKCGLTKRHANGYLNHFKNCNALNESQNVTAHSISTDVISGTASVGLIIDPTTNVQHGQKPPASGAVVKCAVCRDIVQEEDWYSHILSRHDYLAWKFGEFSLDVNDEAAVRTHLQEIAKVSGGLTCSKCGLTKRHANGYLSHFKNCNALNESQNVDASSVSSDVVTEVEPVDSDSPNDTSIEDSALVKCAVCAQYVLKNNWDDHRGSKHNHMAWPCGEQCLGINDNEGIREHLHAITNSEGFSSSTINDEYVKCYADHIKFSHGTPKTTTVSDSDLVKCGVCGQYMVNSEWDSHMTKVHEYLAWKDGDPPIDLNDPEQIRVHLQNLAKEMGSLSCPECGLQRKYVKSYLHHVNSCAGVPVQEQTKSIKCGVCNEVIAEDSLWMRHLYKHNYLAWKHGATPLDFDNQTQLYEHLYNLSKELGGLTCKNCRKHRKYVKPFLLHIQKCTKNVDDGDETRKHLQKLAEKVEGLFCAKCGRQSKYVKVHLNHKCRCGDQEIETIKEEEEAFKCGKCGIVVTSSAWEKHLSQGHDYVAWKDGETPPELDDEEQVHQLLYNFSKQFGGLVCKVCGRKRKYVKSYLEHIKTCDEVPDTSMIETSMSETGDFNNSTLDTDHIEVDFTSGGTCAVCKKEVPAGKWIHHTQKEHNYLAWREGEEPWNVDDFDDINRYLYGICKRMDGLTCNKCGIVRKYVKTYLTHIKSCNVMDSSLNTSVSQGIGPENKGLYQCAMCKEHIKAADWKTHALKRHYNVTWVVGETPIDIKNPYGVERFLKEYKQVYGKLNCHTCGISRVSFAGFYAHIITCGKTEEEIEMFKEVCDICNNKYLCIYKNQHAMIHKVQEYNAELKLKKKAEIKEKEEVELSGKRRAAVKARSVIEKYSDIMSKYAHACRSCGYGTDLKEEFDSHKCEASNEKDFSGDESSAAEVGSSDESLDSDVDSNISNEVNDGTDDEDDDGPQPKKRIRFREPAPTLSKVTRIPFKVDDPHAYIRQGDEDFCSTHFTDEVLYPRWQCQYEEVVESDLTRYLPPLEQSCNVKLGSESDWIALPRFGAKRKRAVTTIFVGASIVCIAWVPLRVEDMMGDSNFLAIACHNGSDCPRYQGEETKMHENFIQIWDFHASKDVPEFAFGIAHDFGTVWSMDWCPSGARDVLSEDTNIMCRLGLLAVACSSGSVYIFSVPYPTTLVKNEFNKSVYKLKPVAELRMTTTSDRKSYQATSVSWSKQKWHSIVLAGYADGSTAYYDLHTKSPLLCSIENNVEVFYPYHDERPHNTCITGADLYPASDESSCGAGVWSSPTGVQMAPRAGAGVGGGAVRTRLHVSAHGVTFAPHACCAVLAGDDAIMHTAITELAWVPPGRRMGAIRCAAGCARCGRVATSMPPTLRVMRLHPAYCDLKKQIVGLIEMTHLAKKRKKQVNNELAMAIEPLTYEDAVAKYGIEFQKISKTDRATQQQISSRPKAHCPERFPLADVESMAFCPSRKHHERLAVATHSGIIFIMNLHSNKRE